MGDSHWGKVFDGRDLTNIIEIGTGYLPGDLDTMTPFGNVAILSVDDEAEDEISSAVILPWQTEAGYNRTKDFGSLAQRWRNGTSSSTRIGVGCNEAIEPSSVFAGSVRIFDEDGNGIDGWGNAQENTVNFTPKEPLKPSTT